MPLKRTRSVTTTTMPTSMAKKLSKRGAGRRVVPKLQLLSAPGTPFPQSCRAVLKYTSYFNMDPGLGLVARWLLRCNSVYDPDYSGAGGQPRGFDQYAALYNQYTVHASRIKMVPCLRSTGAGGQIICGISILPDVGSLPGVDQCADRPFTTWKTVAQQAAPRDNTVYSSWNRAKRFPKEDTLASLSASIAADPAEVEYYEFWAYSGYTPLATNPDDFTMQYEITYDVEFYELKSIAPS